MAHGFRFRRWTIAVIFLALGAGQRTNAAEAGPYFNFEGGPSWVQNVGAKENGFSGTADLDVGARLGMSVGYNINRYAGVEFDTGWLWNQFHNTDTDLTQVPFMLNGVFRLPTNTRFEPYLGAGFGGSYSVITIDNCCGDYDTDFVFAWQALAGVRYNFNDQMSVGLGYKYLGSSSSDYHVGGSRISLETLHNHSVGFVFNMKF